MRYAQLFINCDCVASIPCVCVPLFKVTLGDVAGALALRQMLSVFGAEQRGVARAVLHFRFCGVGVQVLITQGASA